MCRPKKQGRRQTKQARQSQAEQPHGSSTTSHSDQITGGARRSVGRAIIIRAVVGRRLVRWPLAWPLLIRRRCAGPSRRHLLIRSHRGLAGCRALALHSLHPPSPSLGQERAAGTRNSIRVLPQAQIPISGGLRRRAKVLNIRPTGLPERTAHGRSAHFLSATSRGRRWWT